MRKMFLVLAAIILLLSACSSPAPVATVMATPFVPLEEVLLGLPDLKNVDPNFAALFVSEPTLSEGCMVQDLDCLVLSFRSDGEPFSLVGVEVTRFEDSELTMAGSDSYQKFLAEVLGDQFQVVESDELPVGSWFVTAGETVLLGVPYHNLFLFFAVDTVLVDDPQILALDLAKQQIEKLKQNGY